MKKLLFCSVLSVCSVFVLFVHICWSSQPGYYDVLEDFRLVHKIPHDDVEDIDVNFEIIRRDTTFGRLAKYSDIIAVGYVVENLSWSTGVVKVEIALAGCTNGQFIIIDFSGDDPGWGIPFTNRPFVRCVYTNQYRDIKAGYIDWFIDPQTNELTKVFSIYRNEYIERTGWGMTRDFGMLEHFTNIIQAVRFDRNWTNFYYICRDNLDTPSNYFDRIREDSFYDLCGLIKFASTNEARFIYNDPLLVSPKAKAYLLERHPYVKEEEEEE